MVIQIITVHIIEIKIKCKGKFQIFRIIILHVHKKLVLCPVDISLVCQSYDF